MNCELRIMNGSVDEVDGVDMVDGVDLIDGGPWGGMVAGDLVMRMVMFLGGFRVQPCRLEAGLSDDLAGYLAGHGVGFEREVKVGPGCRVDFLCAGGIVIEVKKGKPSGPDLVRQLARYGGCSGVAGMVVVVERCVFDLPSVVVGKPVGYVALNRNWGISL